MSSGAATCRRFRERHVQSVVRKVGQVALMLCVVSSVSFFASWGLGKCSKLPPDEVGVPAQTSPLHVVVVVVVPAAVAVAVAAVAVAVVGISWSHICNKVKDILSLVWPRACVCVIVGSAGGAWYRGVCAVQLPCRLLQRCRISDAVLVRGEVLSYPVGCLRFQYYRPCLVCQALKRS